MRLLFSVFLLAASLSAQALKIPPVKTSVTIEGQPTEVTAWGTVTPESVALTVDLENFQTNLTAILQAELNQSERCGARLNVERATLVPAAPGSVLTAYVHYERYACAKAFGKEIVKRLAGGNGTVEVNLTPSVEANHIALAAEVRKIDADGSIGDVLRSGSFGESMRKKVAASIESAIEKAANKKATLPPEIENAVTLQSAQFADGGAGKLWLNLSGRVGGQLKRE
jgi:hypothetical protein